MKRCVVGIRRGGDAEVAGSGKYAPTVWFPSMATMAAVLSEDNRALLCVIRDAKPKNLTELSRRQVPNALAYSPNDGGIRTGGTQAYVREIVPIARATDFLVLLDSPQGKRV